MVVASFGECSGSNGDDDDSVVIIGCSPGYLDVDLRPPPPLPLTDCVTDDNDCGGLAGVVCVC